MKLSDIVYPITKPNVEFAISIYLRKIFYSNEHNLPKDKPTLFISNHPTAFLEPVIYSGLLDKPIHSLVRGDFFQDKMAKTGLESLNMIAIYRMRDGGVEGLRKNAMTFQYCYDLMERLEQVIIMAEGFTTQQKRLATLQKGAARMALGAAMDRKLEDLVIVPLCANFTAANTFRGEVMINVGAPFSIAPYLESYKESKKPAIDRLTEDMAGAMRASIIHIEDPEDDSLFESVVPILRRRLPRSLWPSWNRNSDRFDLEKKLADYINDSSSSEKEKLIRLVSDYPNNIHLRSNNRITNWLVIILGCIAWLAGSIYRTIPFVIARNIVRKKVEEIEFESPIRFGMGALFTIVWTLIWLFLIPLVFGIKFIWIPLVMVLVIWFSVVYEDVWEVVRHGINWSRLSSIEKERTVEIERELDNII